MSVAHVLIWSYYDGGVRAESCNACAEHVSGAENGAGRKLGERERSGERRSQKTMERERSEELRSGNGAESGLNQALKDRSEVDPTVAL